MAGPARIADAIEEDVSVAVGGVVVRVLASLAAGVVEGVVELESRFELARYGLVASDAEPPADLVELVDVASFKSLRLLNEAPSA